MSEIGIQYCGLILIILLMYLSYRRKRLALSSSRVYFFTLNSSFLCLLSDILSIYALSYFDRVPLPLTFIACKTYISCLVLVAFCGFTYIVTGLEDLTRTKRYYIASRVWVVLGIALIWILPISFHSENEDYYTAGPSVLATYVFALSFVVGTIMFAIRFRRHMARARFYAVVAWMLIWIAAAVIQFLDSTLPMVGFATALGLTIIFAVLENPESNIDRESGAYTAHALMSYMHQRFRENKPFAGINIFFKPDDPNLNLDQSRVLFVSLAEKLRTFSGAIVFRNIGNEFALIFENKEQMEKSYEELREILYEPIMIDTQRVFLETRYILLPDSRVAQNANEIFWFHNYFTPSGVDMDCRVIDEESVKEFHQTAETKEMIAQAIRENRIEVFYQPIYSTRRKQFISAEALVRIREKDGSVTPPGAFIPVAEQSDLILEIGEIVFRQVCQFIKKHDIHQMKMNYIEVNLSVAQCEQRTLAQDFRRIAEETGIDPSFINLEITESATVNSRNLLIQNMTSLLEQGIRFSLDDFGTGQSNLDYVMTMPVDLIKFDRTMTNAYFESEKARFIMDSAMAMVKKMGLEIVAEGIETEEQFKTMEELGIQYIQGYYFSKPLPEEEFVAFITERNGVG